MKCYHDQINFYLGKYFTGVRLQIQRFSILFSWWEVWLYEGRHGTGEELRVLQLDQKEEGRKRY